MNLEKNVIRRMQRDVGLFYLFFCPSSLITLRSQADIKDKNWHYIPLSLLEIGRAIGYYYFFKNMGN
jgi:hypothetical protein